ncbi:ABC transporter permease [Agromyces rhizosphaerae]|uniref:ABC transporter permease n=1 Tax=Agromyces rhizosphaerae TaxID=88374 RepID=A0A9W6FNP7_9MICO|nr:carbohydrate ABC transporter permease [Agromyces rhizosphaerae]GLI26655.1 ABC transporter permease [Agromyces rhizosphaerae]
MIKRVLGLGMGHLLLIGWTILAIVPFILIAIYSLRSNTDLFAYPLGIGGQYHPENYVIAWNGPGGGAGMIDYFTNTAIAGGVAIVVTLTVGSTAAYFATKLGARMRALFLAIFLTASVVPFVLIIIPYFQVFNALSLLSQPAVLGVTYGVLTLPTTVLVLTSYYADFPQELIESATVDGLGEFSAYLQIVLPLSKGALTAVGMLALVFVWAEAQLGIVLLQESTSQTVSVGVLGFQGQFTAQLGPLFAGLSIATIPVIIIYLIFNRFITKGIALGGVFR